MESYLLRKVSCILNHSRILLRSYGEVEIVSRIDLISLVDDLIMKMWSGRLSRVAAQADALSPLDLHALGNTYGLHMRITGLITESMVDDYLVSIAEELKLDAFNHTIAGRINRIARLQGEIHASMP